jgi:hypothetical protein
MDELYGVTLFVSVLDTIMPGFPGRSTSIVHSRATHAFRKS